MAEPYKNHENIKRTDVTIKFILLVLVTLMLSFILIVIEKTLLPYPAFVEEIAKALVVFFLILNLPGIKYKITAGLLFGFLFGLSENIFYLSNIIEKGVSHDFWQRMIFVVPMHIVTVLMILFSGWAGRKFLPQRKVLAIGFLILGLGMAIILHTLFNSPTIRFY